MDTRRRFGVGLLILGIGNLWYGATQLTVGEQSLVFVAIELVTGAILGWWGTQIVRDPDRVDTDAISPRMVSIVGWLGIVLGLGLVFASAVLVVGALT